jgi:tRNA modification GTPase
LLFSERAFLNNKIDLVQAEAIADLIAAESEQSANAAMHSLQGDFSNAINRLLEELTNLRVHVESALDFPEEEIDFLADDAINTKLQHVIQQIEVIKHSSQQGRLLNEGLRVVITGRPNAGKSSLLNALAGTDSAIVSEIAGTTRDVLREKIQIEGVPLHIIDTAGMREASNSIEQEGVRRAQKEIAQADIIINVVDISTAGSVDAAANANEIVVLNKIDLIDPSEMRDVKGIKLSVKTGAGMEALKQQILQTAGYAMPAGQHSGMFTARRRHLEAINITQQHLAAADTALNKNKAGELMAEELRLAQNALAEITGEFSSDDLLGKIFSEFCIGK